MYGVNLHSGKSAVRRSDQSSGFSNLFATDRETLPQARLPMRLGNSHGDASVLCLRRFLRGSTIRTSGGRGDSDRNLEWRLEVGVAHEARIHNEDDDCLMRM